MSYNSGQRSALASAYALDVQQKLMSSEFPEYDDFEWIALDKKGYVAVFTSAGLGPVPDAIKKEWKRIRSITKEIRSLPPTTKPLSKVKEYDISDFEQFASKGIYAFDWGDVERRENKTKKYELISKPSEPVCSIDLEIRFELMDLPFRFDQIVFSETRMIDINENDAEQGV